MASRFKEAKEKTFPTNLFDSRFSYVEAVYVQMKV